jgi:hypothetical protein
MQRKRNGVIARDAFSLEGFANPYSFFIAFSINYMLIGWRSVLNCLRYHDVTEALRMTKIPAANAMPLSVPPKPDAARRHFFPSSFLCWLEGHLHFSPDADEP